MVKENNPRITTKKHLAKAEREKKQTRLLIYGSVAIVVLILLILGYGFLDSKYLRANRAVAKVGNISISASDFRSQTILERIQNINQYNYDQTLLQYAQMFGDYSMYVQAYYDSQNIQNKMADATTFAESKLESMIQDAVIQQQAVMFDPPISVSDEEVDKAMEESFGFFPNGTPTADPTSTIWNTPTISNTQLAILGPTRTPTLELTTSPTATDMPTATDQPAIEILATGESAAQATEQKPAATATSLPTETLQPTATLNGTLTPTSTSTPYTYEEYQKNVDTYIEQLAAFELSVDDLRDFIKARMLKQKVYEEVTKDVAEVQDQVWARHILVSTEGEAREILNRLSNGEDWANIAAEVSIDTATKEDGGDLGWFPKEVMVSEFEESAFSQEIGSISEPVQSSMGFHIIQVVGHETRTVSSRYLASIKQKVFDTWITQFITEENVKRDDMWKEFIPTQPELEIQTQS
jgi:peptidyl-prolyl cis-trans isomerase D